MLIYRVTFILLERAFIVADNSNHWPWNIDSTPAAESKMQ